MSKKPSDEEINKTIAEFMGEAVYTYGIAECNVLPPFTNSLDRLAPVVEKLTYKKDWYFDLYFSLEKTWKSTGYYCGVGAEFVKESKSPSKVLAMACAEAIKNER